MDQMQTGTDGTELKASVRFKGPLAQHIKECTGEDGLWDNISDYLKTLVRRDLAAKPGFEGHLNEVWEHLMPGLLADPSEFKSLSAKDIKEQGRKKAGLND